MLNHLRHPQGCVCALCKDALGSCSLFEEYEIQVGKLNPFCLRSEVESPVSDIGTEDDTGFVYPNSYVAVAPDLKSPDVIWIFKVLEPNLVTCDIDEGSSIPPGMVHISGHFLEKNSEKSSTKKTLFRLSEKLSYIYKESVLYPYVNI